MRLVFVQEEYTQPEIDSNISTSSDDVDKSLSDVGEIANTLAAVDEINNSISNETTPEDANTLVTTAESLLNYIKVSVVLPGKKSFSTEKYRERSIRYTKESLGEAISRGFKTIIDVIKKIINAISRFFKAIWYVLTGEKGSSGDLDKEEKKNDDEAKKIDDEAKAAKERIEAAKKNTPVNVPNPPPDPNNNNTSVTPGNGAQPVTPPATKTPAEIKAEEVAKAQKELDDAIMNYKNGYVDRLKNHNIGLSDDQMKYIEMTPDSIVAVFPKVIGICNNLKSMTEKVNSNAMNEVHTWLKDLDNAKIESPDFDKKMKQFTSEMITAIQSNHLGAKASDGKYKAILRKGYSDTYLLIEIGVEDELKFTQEAFTKYTMKTSQIPDDLINHVPEVTKQHNPTQIKPGYDKTIGIFRGLESSQFKIQKEWEKFMHTLNNMNFNNGPNALTPENQSKARQAVLTILNNYKVITEMIKAVTAYMVKDFDQLKDFYRDIICTRNNAVWNYRCKLTTIQNTQP